MSSVVVSLCFRFTGCIKDVRYPIGSSLQKTPDKTIGDIQKECLDHCTTSENKCWNGGRCLKYFAHDSVKCDCSTTGYKGKSCNEPGKNENIILFIHHENGYLLFDVYTRTVLFYYLSSSRLLGDCAENNGVKTIYKKHEITWSKREQNVISINIQHELTQNYHQHFSRFSY